MTLGRIFMVCGLLLVGAGEVSPVLASPSAAALEQRSLARAQAIRSQMDARYRAMPGRGLGVTEASSTGVIESFELLTPDLLETRVLPADNGIWYGTCTRRAVCPYPARRSARPAGDLVPRRLALELALRTFLETSVDVVGVSLPTAQFTAFIVERTELAREVDLSTLAEGLAGDPSRALAASLARVVDRVTAPRVFVGVALKPMPSGKESWVGVPRWPDFTS